MPKQDKVSADDIKKALDATREDCGEVNNLPAVTEWCSTGCTILDLAISGKLDGGIPVGRMTQVYGGFSTCKTVLGMTILGSAQRAGKLAFFADVERTFDPDFAKMYGLNPDKDFFIDYPRTIEDLFDVYIPFVLAKSKEEKKQAVIVVDCLTATTTQVEMETEMAKGSYNMSRPKQIGIGIRKRLGEIGDSQATLFIIDQSRQNVTGFGVKEITSGGEAVGFYSSVRLHLKKDSKVENAKGITTGFWVGFDVIKNKVSIPYREAEFKIQFDYGMDDIETNLFFLSKIQNGVAKAEKKLTTIKLFGDEKKLSTWVSHIEDNNLEDELRKEVFNVWTEFYKPEPRKPRKWGD